MIRVEKQGVQPYADYRVVRTVLSDGVFDLLLERLVRSLKRCVHGDADYFLGVRR